MAIIALLSSARGRGERDGEDQERAGEHRIQ